MVVDRPDAVALFGLGGGRGIITCWPFGTHLALSVGFQLRLNSSQRSSRNGLPLRGRRGPLRPPFLRVYSGSGLVMVCWGRLRTMCRQPSGAAGRVSYYSTRMPLCSGPRARPTCAQGPQREWQPLGLRGGRRTAWVSRSRYSAVTLGGAPGCGASRKPSAPSRPGSASTSALPSARSHERSGRSAPRSQALLGGQQDHLRARAS
jgi:hypothetical protein